MIIKCNFSYFEPENNLDIKVYDDYGTLIKEIQSVFTFTGKVQQVLELCNDYNDETIQLEISRKRCDQALEEMIKAKLPENVTLVDNC